MVDQDSVVNLVALEAEITTEVSRNSLSSGLTPNIGLVETLVHPSMSSECWFEELSFERKVVETLLERVELEHLVIAAHRNHPNIVGRRQEPQRRAPRSGLRTLELTP